MPSEPLTWHAQGSLAEAQVGALRGAGLPGLPGAQVFPFSPPLASHGLSPLGDPCQMEWDLLFGRLPLQWIQFKATFSG